MSESQCPRCFAYLNNDGTCPVCQAREEHSQSRRSIHRSQRRRIIAKRCKIISQAWKSPEIIKAPGRYSKYNLSCNCWLCKYEKKSHIPKVKYQLPRRRARAFEMII